MRVDTHYIHDLIIDKLFEATTDCEECDLVFDTFGCNFKQINFYKFVLVK